MAFISRDPYQNELKLREIRSAMSAMCVTVASDHVVICGQIVARPSWLSPSQWLQNWEMAQ